MTYVKNWRGLILALHKWLLDMRFWRDFENTPPNWLTLARIVGSPFVPVFVLFSAMNSVMWYCIVLAVFDFLDGFLARAFGWKSKWGAKWDSRADGFLSGFMTFTIFFLKPTHWLEMTVAVVVVSREISIPILRRMDIMKAPKLWLEKAKLAVYLMALPFLLARGAPWWEALWSEHVGFSLFDMGFYMVCVGIAGAAAIATISEYRYELIVRKIPKRKARKQNKARTD